MMMAVGVVDLGMTVAVREVATAGARVREDRRGQDRLRMRDVRSDRRGSAGVRVRMGRLGGIVPLASAGTSGVAARVDQDRRGRNIIAGRVHHSGKGQHLRRAGRHVWWRIRVPWRPWDVRSRHRVGPTLFLTLPGCFCRTGRGTL
jgi:hypothetical protein